jgi:retinol dehydrogenase 12
MFYTVLNVYFTRALASHLPPTCPLVVNTLNPGLCISELRRDTPDEANSRMDELEKEYAWTGEEGSRVLVFAAVGMQGQEEEMKGQYIDNTDICEVKESIYGEEGKRTQQVLWVCMSFSF